MPFCDLSSGEWRDWRVGELGEREEYGEAQEVSSNRGVVEETRESGSEQCWDFERYRLNNIL
jgi:hypothetical protein